MMVGLRIHWEDEASAPAVGGGRAQDFVRSPVRIGRNELNDFRIPEPYVSQWHAVIRFDENQVEYFDLGSTNGTKINDTRVRAQQAVLLTQGDSVVIGKVTLRIELVREVALAQVRAEDPAATLVDADATVQVRQAYSALAAVRPEYEAYRKMWERLLSQIEAAVEKAPPSARAIVVRMLEEACPAVRQESQFIALATRAGGGSVAPLRQAASTRTIGAAEREMLSSARGARLARALDVFCASFIEIRRGLEQFGNDLAVRTFRQSTPVLHLSSADELLGYLTDDKADGDERAQELKNAFADIMIHQVALVSGVMEAVRSLLQRIGPESVSAELRKKPVKLGPFVVKRGFWPISVLARWKRYVDLHGELSEAEEELFAVLFGSDFARSYGEARRNRSPK